MNQFTGDSKYIDVLERSMYNGALAGVSLAGDRFFYVNPLESNGDHHRQAWYGCACCPSQISRFLPSIGNYIYGTSDKALWVNLFIGNTTEVTIDGKKVVMKQETDYPWDGLVKLTVTSEQPLGKVSPDGASHTPCRSTGTKSTVRPTRDIPSSRNGKPAT